MRGGIHWYNQHTGVWPHAACGVACDGSEGDGIAYTESMGRVSCLECQIEVAYYLDALTDRAPSRPAALLGEAGIIDAA